MSEKLKKLQQVRDQCKAVADMARSIAHVTEQVGEFIPDEIIDIVGKRTARQMEWLGDEMNDMDIVEKADEWMERVFRGAQQMFPVRASETTGD